MNDSCTDHQHSIGRDASGPELAMESAKRDTRRLGEVASVPEFYWRSEQRDDAAANRWLHLIQLRAHLSEHHFSERRCSPSIHKISKASLGIVVAIEDYFVYSLVGESHEMWNGLWLESSSLIPTASARHVTAD